MVSMPQIAFSMVQVIAHILKILPSSLYGFLIRCLWCPDYSHSQANSRNLHVLNLDATFESDTFQCQWNEIPN